MANVKIKPIGDRVLVEHIEEKEQVRGGIIIPDSAKEKPQEAKVIALGTGKKGEDGKVQPFEVKVGDRVLITSGDHMEQHGATNTLRLLAVGEGGRTEGLGDL